MYAYLKSSLQLESRRLHVDSSREVKITINKLKKPLTLAKKALSSCMKYELKLKLIEWVRVLIPFLFLLINIINTGVN